MAKGVHRNFRRHSSLLRAAGAPFLEVMFFWGVPSGGVAIGSALELLEPSETNTRHELTALILATPATLCVD